eukprot:COSAG01_NODE_28825_length_652_cov_0.613020_1_plen_71_part_10
MDRQARVPLLAADGGQRATCGLYVAGYGSNQVYEFDTKGNFLNHTWGGRSKTKGPKAELGKFSTNHGCTYD